MFRDTSSTALPEPPANGNGVIIGSSTGVGAVLLVCLGIFCWRRRKHKVRPSNTQFTDLQATRPAQQPVQAVQERDVSVTCYEAGTERRYSDSVPRLGHVN